MMSLSILTLSVFANFITSEAAGMYAALTELRSLPPPPLTIALSLYLTDPSLAPLFHASTPTFQSNLHAHTHIPGQTGMTPGCLDPFTHSFTNGAKRLAIGFAPE